MSHSLHQGPSSPNSQQFTPHLYYPSPSTSSSPLSRQSYNRPDIDPQSSHSIIISPPLKASKTIPSPDRPAQRLPGAKESPKLLNLLPSRRTSTSSSLNVNQHHRISIQSVLQTTIPSQHNSSSDITAVSTISTSPTTPIPSPSSRQSSSHSSHRLSAAMKSLFNRKASITSSSDSSFSNTSSHNSFTSPGLKVSNLPVKRPTNTVRKNPSIGQAQVSYHRPHSPERNVDLLQPSEDHDEDHNGDNCPVCVEDLRMQLPGEKPLVVPNCGHRLHASCFEAVYGSLDHARRTGDVLGLCGICRKDMKLVGSTKGLSKNSQISAKYAVPKYMQTDNYKIHSITRKMCAASPMNVLDLADEDCEDDEDASLSDLDRGDELVGLWHDVDLSHHQSHLHPGEHKMHQNKGKRTIVKPIVKVVTENPDLLLNKDSVKSQHLTCMVTLELPSLYSVPSSSSALNICPLSSIPISSPLSATSVQSKPLSDNSPSFNGSSYVGTALSSQDSSASPLSPRTPATGHFHPNSRSALLSHSSQRQGENALDRVRANSDFSGSMKLRRSRENSINFIPPHPVHLDQLPPLPIDAPPPTQPLQPVLDDLLERMDDWKGHSSSDFGILKKYDWIYVEKDDNCRQFLVYLFEEALLCVSQVSSNSSSPWPKSAYHDDFTTGSLAGGPPLKLKGRVYIRHMQSISEVASSTMDLPSLRIKMMDEKLDAFIMRFEDRTRMDDWCTAIRSLIERRPREPNWKPQALQIVTEIDVSGFTKLPTPASASSPFPGSSYDLDTTRMALDSTRSSKSESLCSMSDRRPTSSTDGGSSLFNGSTKTNLVTTVSTLSSVGEEHTESPSVQPSYSPDSSQQQPFTCVDFPSPHMNPTLRSVSLRHDFCPIDLTLIMSIPAYDTNIYVDSSPSSVKLRLLKQSLQFLVVHLHPRSRLSLVAFTVGSKSSAERPGQLLHTPFLIIGKPDSLKRIEFAIEQISRAGQSEGILNTENWKYFGEDLSFVQQAVHSDSLKTMAQQRMIQDKIRRRLQMLDRTEDKVSVVTAVNLAYDMILPRQQKNPLSGILLLNDSRDCATRPEMALVMTRAEAVHIPIQSIGWGETHNPSSLWQLSNHTGGTYTFVSDHNSIKEAIAGCIGGMLSVGMSNTRVSLSISENKWFKIKKVSGVSHVVSSDGQHADLQVGQLRFGERRDLLVEVEMRSAKEVFTSQENLAVDNVMSDLEYGQRVETGTDAFFRSQVGDGINAGILGDTDAFTTFYECQFDSMNDDVPLFEVNVSYRDPQAGKNVARLPRPVVLMVAVTPSMVDSMTPPILNEPSIVKRRVELLTSDSLSRVLLLVSRRMDNQALRLMNETCRIVSTLIFNLFQIDSSRDLSDFIGPKSFGMVDLLMRSGKMKRTSEHVSVFVMLAGCLQVMKRVVEALEEIRNTLQECDHLTALQQHGNGHLKNSQLSTDGHTQEIINQVRLKFESGMKNFIAEQSGILRDQRTWLIHSEHSNGQSFTNTSDHTNTHIAFPVKDSMVSIIEDMYFRSDYSIWMKNMIENWTPERF